MDPNALLDEILSNARALETRDNERDDMVSHSAADDAEMAYLLAQQVIDLHEWLEKGGFLPTAWKGGQEAGVPKVPATAGGLYFGYRPPQGLEQAWRDYQETGEVDQATLRKLDEWRSEVDREVALYGRGQVLDE